MTLKCTHNYMTLYIFDSMQNTWFSYCLLQTIDEVIVKASKNLDPYLLYIRILFVCCYLQKSHHRTYI